MTLVLEISDSVAETLLDIAQEKGEDLPAYATATLTAHAEEQPPRRTYNFTEAQRAAAREELNHVRPHDPEAVFRNLGLTWRNRTAEEIAADAEAALAEMSPEVREHLTRQGLI